jgi:glycosyltransferase involved in cell wall biosynthesis
MWWAVHLADRAGKPSLLYLHESTTPATFYLGHMSPRILPLIQSTFRLATCVSFLTEATRQYYRPWLGRDNHGINPGWIDVAAIDAQLAKLDRPAIRQQLGIGPDTQLVINVGSVCDRKGQHIFARGVDLFWRQHPAAAARCRFLVIGGRDTLFDGDLQALLRQFDRPNLTIVPATAEPLAYYRAADFFVCSSYEESLPRVIMEAMVARLPILSTGVHGILDLLPDPEHGRLIPPGNSQAICDGLHDVLTHGPDAAARAARARDHVVQHFNSATLLPGHVALAACVASPRP